MRLQDRSLALNMRGADVTLLQRELRLLQFQIPVQEIQFGPQTQAAVLALQRRLRLQLTGVVDQVTAAAINKLVDALVQVGAITGTVRNDSAQPIAGAQLDVLGTDVRAVTNAQGQYTLDKIHAGSVPLRASAVGYQPQQAMVAVAAGKTVGQDFTLISQAPGWVVRGEVTKDGGAGIPAARVVASQVVGTENRSVGEGKTGADGAYEIKYAPAATPVDLRVNAFDQSGGVVGDSGIRHNVPKVQDGVNIVVAADGAQVAYTVDGTVASPDRAGVGGLRVTMVDKNVGPDALLADLLTNERGGYQAHFALRPSDLNKDRPDLQARVYLGAAFLGASDVRYDASTQETVNVWLPAAADALSSEHETLTGALAAHYKGLLGDLKESDDRQDITYLANKTGWDARAVALAALADQFSRNAPGPGAATIPAPLYYALFRIGLPANPDTLYKMDVQTVQSVWKRAIGQGVIPKALEATLPAAAQTFQGLGAVRALDSRAPGGVSTLKEMLQLALGDDAQRLKQFGDLYTRLRGDPPKFWDAVRQTFDDKTTKRLQLDGQLGYLTLNNAAVIGRLHAAQGGSPLTEALDLVTSGYYRAEKWTPLLDGVVPDQVAGATPAEKAANYAALLAAQVRLSFPTAVVAEMVKGGDFTMSSAGNRDGVYDFLTTPQRNFEIGMQPIAQYLARNKAVQITEPVKGEIKRLQRVYQITPSDQAMAGLLKNKLDSAFQIVRYDEAKFVKRFAGDLGGEQDARVTYAKARQVHNAVLNIATSYLVARTSSPIGVHSDPSVIDPAPTGPDAQDPKAGDVVAYPTLEGLFGSMDYCACDQCRSILSPAAYLVNLLQFVEDLDPPAGKDDPQAVLLERRPDVKYLPLTCENTNTPLPYIDVVNETLEYYVAQNLSLAGYTGHDTESAATAEELLASPQFVSDTAYETLAGGQPNPRLFPPPLPFHRSLELLRRHYDKLEVPLETAMETLRADDVVERAGDATYGWRDILMEGVKLSRAEYGLLTDRTLTLEQLYGFPPGTTDANAMKELAGLKTFTRRLRITYEDAIELLKTKFINPSSTLIPRLERLHVPFSTLQDLKDGTLSDGEFDALLPVGLDTEEYGGDVKAWVKDNQNYDRIMGLITIANPTASTDLCSVDALEFRYANPDNAANALRAIDYVRLIRLIRLWKKLGWTIEQTDKAITALYPAVPPGASDAERLDAGFLAMLPRLGFVMQVMDRLKLEPDRDLLALLACWSRIDSHGAHSLYRKMFLNRALLEQDAAFADDGYGNVPKGLAEKLLPHTEALRAAFGLKGSEFSLIVDALKVDDTTLLTLDSISALYRRGWLARKLGLSVREFLLLTTFADLDPFAPLDPPDPPLASLLRLVDGLRAAKLKPTQALYLLWNQDISGKSAPPDDRITRFVQALRAQFAAVESEFVRVDDPTGEIARARMELVYGSDATDFFFGLLGNTFTVQVDYSQTDATLDQTILDAAPGRITYDDFRKQLCSAGILTSNDRDALKTAGAATADFKTAVQALYDKGQAQTKDFFGRYPTLQGLFQAYVTSADPLEKRRTALLENFLPELKRLRKRAQALAAVAAAARADSAFAQAILDDASVLHSAADNLKPALDDLCALETPGLSAQYFWQNTVPDPMTPADASSTAEATLDYRPGADAAHANLPANGAVAGNPISGLWSGFLEVPETGSYNFLIDADVGATVRLTIDGEDRALAANGNVWSNQGAIELTAATLHTIEIKVETVRSVVAVRWESHGHPREVIRKQYLYSASLVDTVRNVYVRFLKTVSLATALKLTAGEIAWLASHPDYKIAGQSWPNTLGVSADPAKATWPLLRGVLMGLLDYARFKAALAPADERLLTVLQDPAAPNNQRSLLDLTQWDSDSLDALLSRFKKTTADLAHLDVFRRVYDAFALVTAFGISASALGDSTINEPDADIVRDFQSALRARYDQADWLDVVRPINDELRGRQRHALVAYVLCRMQESADADIRKIDTPDKLFEYFLMDVQMEPCMLTSRIRHALSSVQLFVERCLMNLERDVAPSSISADQWQWMKRYRIWEANRKVFLWPENWLEPELRDDQSPFFKETMTELLESDITEDTAATALLNYLSKLEEIAKLEPCGMHYVEAESATTSDVVHLVARTAGAHRKYYYRRREFGYWTPWEQIKLDIEDNPVVPVVWKGRLFVFWLRILKEGPLTPQKPVMGEGQTITSLKTSDIKDARVTIRAVLCWSEYHNRKWQPTRTSDVDRPATLADYACAGEDAFDRSSLKLNVDPGDQGLSLEATDGRSSGWFWLFNTHSLPLSSGAPIAVGSSSGSAPQPERDRYLSAAGEYTPPAGTFVISYRTTDNIPPYYNDTWLHRSVLAPKDGVTFRTTEPRHPLQNTWDAPFYFEDSRHVFYVTTTEELVRICDCTNYGMLDWLQQLQVVYFSPLVLEYHPPLPDPAERIGAMLKGRNVGIGDPVPIERFVTEDAYVRRALGTTASVAYGNRILGPGGALSNGVKR